jgi:hypothetical protein
LDGFKKDIVGRLDWIWHYDLEEEWDRAQTILEERGIFPRRPTLNGVQPFAKLNT